MMQTTSKSIAELEALADSKIQNGQVRLFSKGTVQRSKGPIKDPAFEQTVPRPRGVDSSGALGLKHGAQATLRSSTKNADDLGDLFEQTKAAEMAKGMSYQDACMVAQKVTNDRRRELGYIS